MSARVLYNSAAGPLSDRRSAPSEEVLVFHRSMPQYEPTPLHEWEELASELGVRQVYVKDESHRLGMPSFKVLGAAWAIACALAKRVPELRSTALSFDSLNGQLPELTLLAATDGNHGQAVARIAALLGLNSRILVPRNLSEERRAAIAAEGAQVEVVDGSYDDAVRQSAAEAGDDQLLISDTSWPGYVETPRRVIEGYSTILRELDEQLPRRPGLVGVQIGVGAFAAAVTSHYRDGAATAQARMVGVEPVGAACVMASVAAGRPVEVPGPHDSIMAGLNCGTPSMLAWPVLSRGLDILVAIEDEAARDGVERLAHAGIVAGECAGAAPAGIIELLLGPDAEFHRQRLAVDESTDILIFVTEGATGRPPSA